MVHLRALLNLSVRRESMAKAKEPSFEEALEELESKAKDLLKKIGEVNE